MRRIAMLCAAVTLLWAANAFAEPGSADSTSSTQMTTALTDQAPDCSRSDDDDDCTPPSCEASRDDGDEDRADDEEGCPPAPTCDSARDDDEEDEGCPPSPCQASKGDDDEDDNEACPPPPTCQDDQGDNDRGDNDSADNDRGDNDAADNDRGDKDSDDEESGDDNHSGDNDSDDNDSDDDDTQNCPPTYPTYPTYPPQCPPKDDAEDADNGDMQNCPPTYPPPCRSDDDDDDNGQQSAPTYPCKDDDNDSHHKHGDKKGKHKSPPRIAGRARTKSAKVGKNGKFMLAGVSVVCPGDGGKCSVGAASDGAAGARKARAAVVLATVKFSLRAGRSSEVQMQLTKEGKRLLASTGRMTLVTQLSVVQANGVPVTRTFKTFVTTRKPSRHR